MCDLPALHTILFGMHSGTVHRLMSCKDIAEQAEESLHVEWECKCKCLINCIHKNGWTSYSVRVREVGTRAIVGSSCQLSQFIVSLGIHQEVLVCAISLPSFCLFFFFFLSYRSGFDSSHTACCLYGKRTLVHLLRSLQRVKRCTIALLGTEYF